MTSQREAHDFGLRLLSLGAMVRSTIGRHRSTGVDAHPVAQQAGDTIYRIDREVEPVVLAGIERWPDQTKPILLVCEGLGESGEIRIGPADTPLKYRVLVDPVDGTRGLMYDKRSAWFLASIAEDRGEGTRLSEAFASVMVELPVAKQALCDEFMVADGHPIHARRVNLTTGEYSKLEPAPSQASDLRHGFAQVTSFFPGTMQLAAELHELIAERIFGEADSSQALLFNDQYISTGGQFVELMMGHDRFCCDLRPVFYDVKARRTGRPVARGISCHPYDIAGLKVAAAAGVILTDAFGHPLDAPLSVFGDLHWCGYSNQSLRSKIEPVIQGWLAAQLS